MAVDARGIIVDDDVKKRKAGKIAGLLVALFVLIALCAGGALWLTAIRVPETSSRPASIKLAWDKSPSPNVTGYKILIGPHPRGYTDAVNVGNEGTVTLTQLMQGTRYYIVVVAVDAEGKQSAPSNEIEAVAE